MTKQKGFSLIEILVALTIISVIGIVVVQAFLATVMANTKAEVMREIKQSGDLVMSIITKKINSANTVLNPAGNNQTSLQITNSDGSDVYEYKAETIDSGCGITESINGATSVPLTPPTVTLDPCEIYFNVLENNGTKNRVKVIFTLEQFSPSTNQVDQASMKFETTAVMRNIE